MDHLREYSEADTSVSLESYERTLGPKSNCADSENFQWPIFQIIKSTLQFPIESRMKAERLTHDIMLFCQAEEHGAYFGDLCNVWEVFFGVVRCLPPNSPWQKAMVEALQNLQRQPGHFSQLKCERSDDVTRLCFSRSLQYIAWRDFFYATMEEYLIEIWQGHEPWDDCNTPEERTEKRLNLVHFMTKMTWSLQCRWQHFAAMDIEAGLEAPLDAADPERDTKMRAAMEWIREYRHELYEYLLSDIEPGLLEMHRSETTKQECRDRWAGWQERVRQAAEDPSSHGFSPGCRIQANATLKLMKMTERNYSNGYLYEKRAKRYKSCSSFVSGSEQEILKPHDDAGLDIPPSKIKRKLSKVRSMFSRESW